MSYEPWLVIRLAELTEALQRAYDGEHPEIVDEIVTELYANSTKEWHPK